MESPVVLKSVQSSLLFNLMMAVFWVCFHTAVEAIEVRTLPLRKGSFANDLMNSTNQTTLLTTGTTDRIKELDQITMRRDYNNAGSENKNTDSDTIYCNATCDGYLCWPATPAGETFYQNCPKGLLSNVKMCAFRRCGPEGLWLGRHLNDSSPKGWTNYTPCFPTLVRKILDKVNEDEAEAQFKFETAINTRTIEMVGIVSSLLTICAAIFIFNFFPSLHNRRTVIHRHLFYGLLMEVSVRLVLYTQQSYSFDGVDPREENARKGIEYFPYVCEGAYVLLEYSRLVVYAWMFIEGIFLNTLISANTLRNEIPIKYFYIGGWGGPAIVIAIWATVVGRHYSEEPLNTCWYGYNYLPSYYIIQGPILAIVLINMLFLGTIMSVIIMKLRRTNDSELRKVRKTIRATLILVPLLGIINIFNLFDYPLDGSSTGFAIWAYFTHFFRSFQGVFISFIYCFTNGEVIKAIKKKFERRTWCRFGWLERRRAQPAVDPRERPVFAIADNENIELVPMPVRSWTRPSSTNMMSDIEAGPSTADAMADSEHTQKQYKPKKSSSIYNLAVELSPHGLPDLEFIPPSPPSPFANPRYDNTASESLRSRPLSATSGQNMTSFTITTETHSEFQGVVVNLPVKELPRVFKIKLNTASEDIETVPVQQKSVKPSAPPPPPECRDQQVQTPRHLSQLVLSIPEGDFEGENYYESRRSTEQAPRYELESPPSRRDSDGQAHHLVWQRRNFVPELPHSRCGRCRSQERSQHFEHGAPPPASDDIPPFDRPAAVFRRHSHVATPAGEHGHRSSSRHLHHHANVCCCSICWERFKRQLVTTPQRHSAASHGCYSTYPLRSSRRTAQNVFVRPGLVTRDSVPRGAGAISSCL